MQSLNDRFCGGNPSGFTGSQIPLISRIIHVSDRIEVQIDKSQHIFKQRDRIISAVKENDFYDPEVISAFMELSDTEYFWLDMMNKDYAGSFFNSLSFFGKLGVPNHILNKPGKLDKDEYDIIKQHPYYNYNILRKVEGLEAIAFCIGCHHETLDKKGYPFKINPDFICLGSRIITTADVFCALLEDRPYRSRMTFQQAVIIMEEMAKEKKLDSKLVETVKLQGEVFRTLVDQYNQ